MKITVMQGWKIKVGAREIDVVFFDSNMSAEDVARALQKDYSFCFTIERD